MGLQIDKDEYVIRLTQLGIDLYEVVEMMDAIKLWKIGNACS